MSTAASIDNKTDGLPAEGIRTAVPVISRAQALALVPPDLAGALEDLRRESGRSLYLSGGSLRDLLLGRKPHDIDLTVDSGGMAFARDLAARLRGAFVPLDEREDVGRVVALGLGVDVAAFRDGATSIEADLRLRDFTLNALAADLGALLAGREETPLIDPCGGLADLEARAIRLCHDAAFADDPLRMLRAWRLAAVLNAVISPETEAAVRRDATLVARAAVERQAAELNALMLTPRAHAALMGMRASGLLFAVLPELRHGEGVAQPAAFHHLDVLDHNLEALRQAEWLVADPALGFPAPELALLDWLADAENRLALKWAALLHDVGKPATRTEREDGRVTFYQHEREGQNLTRSLAARLRWSKRLTERVGLLVASHMRPFQLLNVWRSGELTLKACIRLAKRMGDDLPGLFLVSQADAMAGLGTERPPELESELAGLWRRVERVRRERMAPVASGPPLVNGRDLIRELSLSPGPQFKKILAALELAHMAGEITNREEALEAARKMAER